MTKTVQKFERLDTISKQSYKLASDKLLKESSGFSGGLYWLLTSTVDLESSGTMVDQKGNNKKWTTDII